MALRFGGDVEDAEEAAELGGVPGRVEAADEGAEALGGHPGIEELLLGDVADEAFLGGADADGAAAEELDLSAVRAEDAHEHAEGGGLAGAVAAEETEDGALGDVEVERVDRADLAEGAREAAGAEDGGDV